MLSDATSFDRDVSTWNVAKVTDFYGTFGGAVSAGGPKLTGLSDENKCRVNQAWSVNPEFDPRDVGSALDDTLDVTDCANIHVVDVDAF